jgi:hypothetical protein
MKRKMHNPKSAFCIMHSAISILHALRSLCPLCLCGYGLVLVGMVKPTQADEPAKPAAPLVVPVDGQPFAAVLTAIDQDGQMMFRPAAEAASPAAASPDVVPPRTLAADELVRSSHPAKPRPQTFVLLGDGSGLVTAADWSGGAAVVLDGNMAVVRSDVWGDVRLPRSSVRGLVFATRRHSHDRQRLEGQVRSAHTEQDEVLLTNQDRLSGSITQLSGGSLTLATEAGDVKLPLSRVEAVVFANSSGRETSGAGHEPSPNPSLQGTGTAARPQPPAKQARLAVSLRDGSLLYATSVHGNDENLSIELAGGTRLDGGTIDDVAATQSLGGRFTYLSDLEPSDYRHVPYLDVPWPYRRDRSVAGQPLTVGGDEYLKGIGMHSAGRLTYTWDGSYRRFDAEIAIDDSAGGRGSVVFGVYVLRADQWQRAYQSKTVRGGQPPRDVSVDLAGAQGITLTVDFADRGDELDRADWLDARLVK